MTNYILPNFVNNHMINRIPYFCKPLLGPILYVIGMKKITTKFAPALTNVLPALTFIVNWFVLFIGFSAYTSTLKFEVTIKSKGRCGGKHRCGNLY